MVGLRFMPLQRLGYGISMMLRPAASQTEGEITPFQALMTSLSATIGTGNIAGVAGAIAVGGPGAVFWMWIIAIFGIATKYAEAVLAVQFRETDGDGNHVGGPMYYIRNGLGSGWSWMAGLPSRLTLIDTIVERTSAHGAQSVCAKRRPAPIPCTPIHIGSPTACARTRSTVAPFSPRASCM